MDWKVLRRDVVTSTNEVAKELVAEGTEPATVVVAAKQIAGRGRFGRRWASPRGGLYVSAILREELRQLPLLSLASALAVVDVLETRGLQATLKWPNDVQVGDAKVAGILVEGIVVAEGYWAVVGIGINSDVYVEDLPVDLEGPATTLRHELGRRVDNETLLADILAALEARLPGREGGADLVARYKALCTTLGQDVTIRTAAGTLEGHAVDVDPQGFLILETPEGERVEVAEGTVRPRS